MNAARPAGILRQLEQSGASDADLLARFVATRDATAFAELVRRHGALVLGVCRRVTGHSQDAEDAFQATFLVLAQKAGSLRNAALLGNFLYGVAFRVAWRAKRSALRRRAREVPVSAFPEPHAPPVPLASEVQPILDEELAALPAHYRDAIVLCDLQGASREEAAAALGVPEGTLSSRLANGRKKLAARLTKRGVALSAAALPLAVAQAQAAVTLPNELVTKTGGLVADWAAGGAVPGALARLTDGGFVMRKALVFSAVMGVAVAGAVFAARPDDAPPGDPPKPPVVAHRAEPQPKEEPKPGEKVLAFTDAPKKRHSFDVALSNVATVLWNATGTHIAIYGARAVGEGVIHNRPFAEMPERKVAKVPFVAVLAVPMDRTIVQLELDAGTWPVAVAPDGNGLVTAVREYNLISGHHHLQFRHAKKVNPDELTKLDVVRKVELDLPETHGYAFAADWKTYRTVAHDSAAAGRVTKLEVLEVDATTGKVGKSLLKLDFGTYSLSANGKRLAVLSADATKVTVHDVDTGAKACEHTFAADTPIDLPGGKTAELPPWQVGGSTQPFLLLSPDGRRLVVSRGTGRTHVINADTGAALPKLEGAALARTYPDTPTFTRDGRLLAATYLGYNVTADAAKGGLKGRSHWSSTETFLTVWDTQTGKALKTWKTPNSVASVTFSPTKPLLAILEPNGADSTRVGFWDFAEK